MMMGSLWSHFEMQHNVYTSFALPADALPPVVPWKLTVLYDVEEGKYRYPMLGCPQGEEEQGCKTPFNLRWHFGHQRPVEKVVIGGKCLRRC